MKRQAMMLSLILIMCSALNQVFALDKCANTPIEVTQIKEIGLSDSDETKSVIEVQWCVRSTLQPNHSNFNVTVEVIYADGAILIFDEQAENSARSAQIEVPTLHTFRGKKPAIIKEIKAFVVSDVKD